MENVNYQSPFTQVVRQSKKTYCLHNVNRISGKKEGKEMARKI